MAVLRLIVVGAACAAVAAAFGLGACGQAGAAPSAATGTSKLDAPPGWQALPELAQAITAAVSAQGVTVEGTDAWGETAVGCYGVWVKLIGGGATSDEVIRGLDQTKLVVHDVAVPGIGHDGVVELSFEKPPYRGRLRVRLATGSVTAVACFANDREPGACDQPCTALLAGLP